jgi:hypothetical protein
MIHEDSRTKRLPPSGTRFILEEEMDESTDKEICEDDRAESISEEEAEVSAHVPSNEKL